MTTSGSVDFNLNRNEIIKGAYRLIGVSNRNQPLTSGQIQDGSQALNLMIKTWQKDPNLWRETRATLFTVIDQQSYTLNSSGANAVDDDDLIQTTLTAQAVLGASTITVDSITGISDGDNIGILQDNNVIHFTTVNGTPAGSTITLTDVTTNDAASGKAVYAFTAKIFSPKRIVGARLRQGGNIGGNDIQMFKMSSKTYDNLSLKSTSGVPTQYYFDRQLLSPKLFVWPTSNNEFDNIIKLTYERFIMDFDIDSDDPDFPQEWLETIKFNLAVKLAIENSINLADLVDVVDTATLLYEEIKDFDTENTSVTPELDLTQ